MSDDDKQCTHISTCELYQHFALEASVAVWKILYCSNDYGRCARYKLACEGKPVPSRLLPNGESLNV